MHMPRGLGDTTELTSGSDRFIVLDGISFQSEHFSDPGTWLGGSDVNENPSPFNLVFFLTIWEAIMILPFAQGIQAPAYLPNLTDASAGGQQADLADRVLWKRITLLPMWGLNVPFGNQFPQLTATMRDTAAGPQRVKSRARLDDRHGLYYVRNFVHDIFFPSSFVRENCGTVAPHNGIIPVINDSWFKVFYHSRK